MRSEAIFRPILKNKEKPKVSLYSRLKAKLKKIISPTYRVRTWKSATQFLVLILQS